MGAFTIVVVFVVLLVLSGAAGLGAYLWSQRAATARAAAEGQGQGQSISNNADTKRAVAHVSSPTEATLSAALHAEREQIYADLHDDVGAKLLELIYRAESPENAALARAALSDLRDVVSRTRGEPASLLESLGEMECEAQRRLGSAGITLNWRQDHDIAERALDAVQHLHLFRIVREAISNAIRHAHAQCLNVRLAVVANILRIEIKDDGVGLAQAGAADAGAGTGADGARESGRGKDSMRKRADQLNGHITWRGGTEGGTRVLLSLPLDRALR
jgi:signal transduction histidine kinase